MKDFNFKKMSFSTSRNDVFGWYMIIFMSHNVQASPWIHYISEDEPTSKKGNRCRE